MFWLEYAEVRDKLNVARDQWKQAERVASERHQALRAASLEYHSRMRLALARQAGPAVFEALDAEQRRAWPVLQQAAESAVLGVLTPGQRARLEQVELQASGPGAFRGAAHQWVGVWERLKLDASQVAEVRALADRCAAELERVTTRAPGSDGPGVPPEQRRALAESVERKAREVRTSALKAIEAVLTAEQRAAYRALLGEPFDFASLR